MMNKQVTVSERLLREGNKTVIKRKAVPWVGAVLRLALLIGVSYVIIYPIMVKLSVMFMAQADITDVTVKWVPRTLTLDNIRVVADVMNFVPSLIRTFGICLFLSTLQVMSCTLAAYGFARFKFRGRGFLFALVISSLVIPPQTYIITLFTQFQYFDVLGIVRAVTGERGINLLNGIMPFVLLSLTATGIRSGLFIYILRQSFRGLPMELEEAAKTDGAGTFRTFFQIMLPNVLPTVLVSFILSFVWQYNDTFYTNIFAPDLNMLSQALQALPFTITTYLGGWETITGVYTSVLINTGSLLVILPLLMLYTICQKFFVQSVERSGLVG